MFPKIRWRIAIPYAVLISAVMMGLAFYLLRPFCLSSPTCPSRSIWITTFLLVAGATGLALIISERTAQPIRRLTAVVHRIMAGDVHAHLLPQTRDEMGDLTRAFNQMMEQLNEKIAQLEKEHGQLATVLTYMADGVLIADEIGIVRLVNPGAIRLLKAVETAVLGHSIAQVLRHHQLIELWQRCRNSSEEQVEAVEIGQALFMQVVITPFQEKGVQGYLVILKDLTPIRRLETVRRDFISNLSHELRTPLASLRAVVETLQDSKDDPEATQRFLGRAEREVDTLTQMVEELLELSRIESGRVPLKLTNTAVSDLILIPLERLRNVAERGQVELILNLPANLPPVLADAGRVQQVVTNLVHNAIKFTPPKGKITIHAAAQSAEMLISIHDTGVGIPAEDLPRIFERFYKSDRARTRGGGGTGLGLAIARHLVQAHNGRIWAESKEGHGSTFYFTLPISR